MGFRAALGTGLLGAETVMQRLEEDMKGLKVVLIALVVLACGAGDPAPVAPAPPPPEPTELSRVGTGEFEVVPGGQLREPLAVRAWNATGNVSGVEVRWEIVAGAGEFLRYPDGGQASATSRTDTAGVARMFFRISSRGPATISASTRGVPGAVSFMVTPINLVEIVFGAAFDCYAVPDPRDPSLFEAPKGTVPVGVTVQWTYGRYMHPSCRARIVSTEVPPGGKPFDTGLIAPGESARVTLDVAGDWKYEDAKNGGGGVLKVR